MAAVAAVAAAASAVAATAMFAAAGRAARRIMVESNLRKPGDALQHCLVTVVLLHSAAALSAGLVVPFGHPVPGCSQAASASDTAIKLCVGVGCFWIVLLLVLMIASTLQIAADR
jgi:hypothetical protein